MSSRVTRVLDADTIGIELLVRLAGIKAPERGEEGYEEANDFARIFLADEKVYVRWYLFEATWGRLVCDIKRKRDGKDLGEALVGTDLAERIERPSMRLVMDEEREDD